MAEGRKKERGIAEEAQAVGVSQKKQQIVTQIAVLQLQLQLQVIISALFFSSSHFPLCMQIISNMPRKLCET